MSIFKVKDIHACKFMQLIFTWLIPMESWSALLKHTRETGARRTGNDAASSFLHYVCSLTAWVKTSWTHMWNFISILICLKLSLLMAERCLNSKNMALLLTFVQFSVSRSISSRYFSFIHLSWSNKSLLKDNCQSSRMCSVLCTWIVYPLATLHFC